MPRYEILRRLGEGGQGQVSLVRDHGRGGRLVALKRVAADQHARGQLALEFERLQSLRQRSLARAYDFGEDEQGAYFTSEYVDGPPFLLWAKTASEAAVCAALAELLAGLELLHSRGLVHGDLSPANVLVALCDPQGLLLPLPQPKLLDLGGACLAGELGTAVTPGYAAPEVITGRGALPASDLYAFGALMTEVLYGQRPFCDDTASRVLQRQLEGEPCLPLAEASALAALCRDLLAREPSARPQSATLVRERLASATGLSLAVDWTTLRGGELPAPKLVGRTAELAALLSLVDRLGEEQGPRTAEITGPQGSGKSALLAELAYRAELAGCRVIGRAALPVSAADLAVDLACVAGDALSPAARSHLQPWLAQGSVGGATQAPCAWSEAVGFAFVEALTVAVAVRPLLILCDDLDLATPFARKIAEVLGRALDPLRPSRPRALLVAASVVRGATELPSGVALELLPLPLRDAEHLVTSMLPGVAVPRDFVSAVCLAAAGWPGACEELVRTAVGSAESPDLESLAKRRVAALPIEAKRVLVAVAAAVEPVPLVTLAVLAEQELLENLMSGAFLAESSARAVPCVRAVSHAARAAAASLDPQERNRAIAALATALELAAQPSAAHRLWLALSDDAAAFRVARDAARLALEHGDLAAAGDWYEKVLAAKGALACTLAEVAEDAVATWRRLGDFDRALSALPILAQEPRLIALLRCELTLEQGRHRDALDLAVEALSAYPADLALLGVLAACQLQLGQHEQCLATVQGALAERQKGDDGGAAVARLAGIGGLASVYLGQFACASSFFARASRDFEHLGDRLGQLKVSANLGVLYWRQGKLDQAASSYDRAVVLARELGDRTREGLHLKNRAAMAQAADDFAGAYEDYQAALDIASLLGNGFFRAQVEVNLADLLVHLGDFQAASRLAVQAIERCRALGQDRLEVHGQFVAAKAAAIADPLAAESRLGDARRRFAITGDEAFRLCAELLQGEMRRRRGDVDGALAIAEQVQLAASQGGLDKEKAFALLLKARALADGEQELSAVLGCLDEAERYFESCASRDELWRLWLLRSRTLERSGDKRAAAQSEKAARDGLTAMLTKVPVRFRQSFVEAAGAATLVVQSGADETHNTRWAKDIELLMEINRELTRELDPKRLLGLIMERAVELTGAERGMVIMSRGDKLEPVVAHQIVDETEISFSRSVAEKVVSERRSVLAVDALDDDRFRQFVSVNALKLRSILAVPLSIRRRVVGVIYLDSRLRSGLFSDADHRLLEAFGAQAAIALETARLVSENQRRCADLEQANTEILALSAKLEEKLESNEAQLRRVGALLQQTQCDEATRLKRTGLVGRAASMQAVSRLIDRIALAEVPVYIFGASGTGKELVARAIHAMSERRDKPFVAINCGALPAKLLASELFGHVKGAYTGAVSDRQGLFKLADKGVLFLDEVADMDAEMQAHLLRVLQDGRFRPLGGNQEQSADVRILCAANRDLAEEVRKGRFREDLFYRLNVVRIDVPSLAERREDIPLLVEHFLRRHQPKHPPTFAKEALDLFVAADWPGNVRELENEVLRAIAMSPAGQPITPADLSPRLRGNSEGAAALGSLKERVDNFERIVIQRVLGECQGNATHAARLLGISRAGLYKKLGKHELAPR